MSAPPSCDFINLLPQIKKVTINASGSGSISWSRTAGTETDSISGSVGWTIPKIVFDRIPFPAYTLDPDDPQPTGPSYQKFYIYGNPCATSATRGLCSYFTGFFPIEIQTNGQPTVGTGSGSNSVSVSSSSSTSGASSNNECSSTSLFIGMAFGFSFGINADPSDPNFGKCQCSITVLITEGDTDAPVGSGGTGLPTGSGSITSDDGHGHTTSTDTTPCSVNSTLPFPISNFLFPLINIEDVIGSHTLEVDGGDTVNMSIFDPPFMNTSATCTVEFST